MSCPSEEARTSNKTLNVCQNLTNKKYIEKINKFRIHFLIYKSLKQGRNIGIQGRDLIVEG